MRRLRIRYLSAFGKGPVEALDDERLEVQLTFISAEESASYAEKVDVSAIPFS